MATPGDEITAGTGSRRNLRASHADREQVIDTLKAAFVQGRLARNEFDQRVEQVLASRTYGDLAALTADLPTGPVRAQPAGVQPSGQAVPAHAQSRANKALLWGSWAVVLLTIGFALGILPAYGLAGALYVAVLPLLIATPVAGTLTLDAWRESHPRGQLPPTRPAQHGYALEDEHGSSTGDDLITCEARKDARRGQWAGRTAASSSACPACCG
jgi:hypothetical protein